MNTAFIPNFSFQGGLEVAHIYLSGRGGWGGWTVIIRLISVSIEVALNCQLELNLATDTCTDKHRDLDIVTTAALHTAVVKT